MAQYGVSVSRPRPAVLVGRLSSKYLGLELP